MMFLQAHASACTPSSGPYPCPQTLYSQRHDSWINYRNKHKGPVGRDTMSDVDVYRKERQLHRALTLPSMILQMNTRCNSKTDRCRVPVISNLCGDSCVCAWRHTRGGVPRMQNGEFPLCTEPRTIEGSLCKAWSISKYILTCFAYCQDSAYFRHCGLCNFIFSQSSSLSAFASSSLCQ